MTADDEPTSDKTEAPTVENMIAMLQKLPPKALVVMSKDGEGNAFTPFSGYDQGLYTAENTWSGEFRGEDDEPDEDDDEEPTGVLAVCLFGVN